MEEEYFQWEEKYKPVKNSQSYAFETYGADLDRVRATDKNLIWTLVDGDDGNTYLVQGYHFVNRINYFIASVLFVEGDKAEYLDTIFDD